MVDGTLIVGFSLIFNGFCWKWGFGHPQLGLLCGAALSGTFFLRKTNVSGNMILNYSLQMFCQTGPNLLLTRGTTIKTGILTLTEFWWVPQIPEMVVPESSHDRSSSKESSQNVPSNITISGSDFFLSFWRDDFCLGFLSVPEPHNPGLHSP